MAPESKSEATGNVIVVLTQKRPVPQHLPQFLVNLLAMTSVPQEKFQDQGPLTQNPEKNPSLSFPTKLSLRCRLMLCAIATETNIAMQVVISDSVPLNPMSEPTQSFKTEYGSEYEHNEEIPLMN